MRIAYILFAGAGGWLFASTVLNPPMTQVDGFMVSLMLGAGLYQFLTERKSRR